ncbi:MAG: hypothetical protein GY930_05360 [bacterium]|nr:hypothetical protein [bacterium]
MALSFFIAWPGDRGQKLPKPVLSVLQEAEEWRIYFGVSGDLGYFDESNAEAASAYRDAAEMRMVFGGDQQDLLYAVVEAIDDWPSDEEMIIAAIDWAYMVCAETDSAQVTLLFKSTGEAVFYRSTFKMYPGGRFNLADTWRDPFDRFFGPENH